MIRGIDKDNGMNDKFGTIYLKIDDIGGWVNSVVSMGDKLVLARISYY